ncbi:MAG: hypothetical protein IAE86_06875 [Burkholderiaceae bacterium]|nr:hypothetical protein [Burkholderiaceae bacterium]
MSRKPAPAAKPATDPTNVPAVRDAIAAADQLAVIETDRANRLKTLAGSIGYQGELSGQALLDGALGAKHRLGMAVLEFGAYLLLLKEGCAHGQFGAVLDRVDINQKSANKYMAVTLRFANYSTSSNLERIGFSKMAELLPLDDEQLEDLIGDESKRDEIARMSVKELRATVRKERADRERWKSAAEEANEKLVLSKKLKLAATDWPERFKGLLDQVDLAHRALVGNVEGLAKIMVAGFEDAPGPGEEESLESAREMLAERMAQAIDTSFERLEKLRSVFDRGLRNFAPEA